MRTTGIFDDALSVKMGTSGVLYNLKEIVEIDYVTDEKDDDRRSTYIKVTREAIIRLEKFAEQFNDQVFSNFIKRYKEFLKEDLRIQLHLEKISDDARDKLHKEITISHERLTNENKSFEELLMTKSYDAGDLKTALDDI